MDAECRIDVDAMNEEIHEAEKMTPKGHKDLLWVSDQELLDELKDEELNNTFGAQEGDSSESLKKVQKVPEIMLQSENLKKYYKPRAFSIGPIHAADSDLIRKSKKLKVKLAARFIQDSGKTRVYLLNEIKSNIKDLKGFFGEEVIESYSDHSLARLLFLDGCALLQFIHNPSNATDLLQMMSTDYGQAALIEQDLFLLDNQIPYKVLKLLMGDDQKKYLNSIYNFVLRHNFFVPDNWLYYLRGIQIPVLTHFLKDRDEPAHLLDLLRLIMIFLGYHESSAQKSNRRYLPWNYFHYNIPWFQRKRKRNVFDDIRDIAVTISKSHYNKLKFRNVGELKSAGIDLKQNDSCNVSNVSFTSQYCNIRGELKLPPIIVDDSTACKLLNLVAYELYLSCDEDRLVTSYVNFLYLLIDSEQDVKELRAANILRHRLSSDREVSDLFNNLGLSSVLVPATNAYSRVIADIQAHFENKLAIGTAKFLDKHCSSPSTVLAFLLATITCFLTINQFWSAIFPKVGLLDNAIVEFYNSA